MNGIGWYSEHDNSIDEWYPVLQMNGGPVALDTWFESKEASDKFIADHILGKGLLDPSTAQETVIIAGTATPPQFTPIAPTFTGIEEGTIH